MQGSVFFFGKEPAFCYKMIGKVIIIMMRKQAGINKNRQLFLIFFVITAIHTLNLIINIMIVIFFLTKIENQQQLRQKAKV